MSIQINLSLLEPINYGHVFLTIPPAISEPLQSYPKILDRLMNALEFVRSISGDYEDRFRCGLIRAALTELISVEDVKKTLVKNGSLVGGGRKMNNSGHPLLCVVRELRNLEIHLSSATVNFYKKDFLWGNVDNPAEGTPVNWPVYYVDNLSIREFWQLNNYKLYDGNQFASALKWFDQAQRSWGISEMLFRAICRFSNELASDIR